MLTKFFKLRTKSNKSPSLNAVCFGLIGALSLSFLITACSNENTGSNPTPEATPTTADANSDSPTAKEKVDLRVGFQKSGTILFSLKGKQALEKAFQPAGGSVTWSEFTQGLPMVEALNAGAIDIAYVGEAPPIFGQAAGDFFNYIAVDPYGVEAEAILVPQDSPIKTVAELKGKSIGVAKGSNAHYLAVAALESVGLKPSDVKFKFLKPSDGRAAFEKGDIDAWSIWDPYLAAGEVDAKGRVLVNAKGLAPNVGYYLASKEFLKNNPEAVELILEEIRKESAYAVQNPKEIAKLLSPALGISVSVLEKAEKRRVHDALPLTDEVIEKQQKIADTFANLKLIPKAIIVKDAVWNKK